MVLARGLAIVAVVAALAQAERKGVLQGMLSRPLVIAPLLGWLLGHGTEGLVLATPLELFWLGGLNIGANLPDNEVVGTAAVIGGAALAAGTDPVTPALALVAFMLLAPTAILGRLVDEMIERRNVALAGRFARALHEGRLDPTRVLLAGLVAPSLVAAILAAGGAALGAFALPRIMLEAHAGIARLMPVGFIALSAGTGAAAVASIRASRAPFAAGLGAMAGLTVLLTLWALAPGAAG